MKFIISQQELSKALNLVSTAISNRSTMNILKGILVEVSDGVLRLTGTDNFIRIEKRLEVIEYENGSAVIPAKLFSDIIRKLSGDMVSVSVNEEKRAEISTSSSNFNIVTFPADEFPEANAVSTDNSITVNKENLISMVRKTSFAASRDDARGVLTGILINSKKDMIDVVALDGFRIAAACTDNISDNENEIIISSQMMDTLCSILSDSETENGEVDFMFDEKKAEIKTSDSIIQISLLDGKFVNYENLIPSEFATEVTISRSLLKESIERASLLALDGRNNLIRLTFKDDTLFITSRSDSGNVREEIPAVIMGNNIEIGFNSKYLLEGLKAIEDENIFIKLNSNINPCIIQPSSGNYTYLLLPVRLTS